MNTIELAYFFLRLRNCNHLSYVSQNHWEINSSALSFNIGITQKEKIHITTSVSVYGGLSIRNSSFELNKNSTEAVNETWLTMPNFRDTDTTDLYLNFLLYPYLLENPKESLHLDFHPVKKIKIKELYELVLLYAFCRPKLLSPQVKETKTHYILSVKKFGETFYGQRYWKINETIFRSYITQTLIEKTLEIFGDPNYERYKLYIEKDLLYEFAAVQGNTKLERVDIATLFVDPIAFAAGLQDCEVNTKKFNSRFTPENFILLM